MRNAITGKANMLGSGQISEILFIALAKESDDFLCSFPGHYIYMKRIYNVELQDNLQTSKNHKS